MSTEKAKENFWDAMEKSAASAKSAPSWKQAGINLSERNYTTFSAKASTSSGGESSLKVATANDKKK